MALIECSQCGKKISDTVSKCIHCGADIHANIHEESIISPKNKENSTIKYDRLTRQKQLLLEKEFLIQDKRAMRFRRMGLELPKLASLGGDIFLIFGGVMLVLQWLFNAVFEQKPSNLFLVEMGLVLGILVVALSLIVSLIAFFVKIVYKRSFKHYIYTKKYQVWLKEVKDIEYVPHFLYDKEKFNFEKVDLTKMDL